MKIALLVEGSTKHHAREVWEVLSEFSQHECYHVGMRDEEGEETLTFLHTSMMAGILLNVKAVDFVIGGCGTGQGFLNGTLAFPNIFCGLIYDPLEAWLFMQVNAGNCISLPMNRGWGLAGKEQIRLILNQAFSAPFGGGYPPERADLIRSMHEMLYNQSNTSRKSFVEIIPLLDRDMLRTALNMQGVKSLIDTAPESAEKSIVLNLYSGQEVT